MKSAFDTTRPLKFSQARDHILEWIRQGRLPTGGKLPSERELARQLAIDHRTVRRGLAELVAAGLVIKRPRVGNFVRDMTPPEMVTQVALILPDWMLRSAPRHPVLAPIHQGVSRAMDPDRYALSTLWYHRDRFWEDAGGRAVSRRFRAALVFPQASQSCADGIERLVREGVRVACIDYRPYLDALDVFSVDTAMNSILRKLLEGLIERGHRRVIAALYTPWSLLDEAMEIVRELSERHGLGDPQALVQPIPSDGYRAKNEVLRDLLDSPNRPTAIVAPDEFVVSYLFRLCYERRLAVPEDLSIATVVDSTPHAHPIAVTAPDSLWQRASELAAQHLAATLAGEASPTAGVKLRADIVWTGSVSSRR